MKLKTKIIALLALASSALVIPANAAVTFTAGDLILAVRSNVQAQTYMVNLGAATTYRDATVDNPSIVTIGTDLVNTFGADWNTRANVTWGIFGVRASQTDNGVVNGDPGQTIYVSRAEIPVGEQEVQWGTVAGGGTITSANHNTAAVRMGGVGVAFAGGTQVGSNNATVLADTLFGNDYDIYGANTTGNVWGAFVQGNASRGGVNGNFGAGTAGTALDLFRSLGTITEGGDITGGLRTGSYQGTFHIDDNGVVGYSVAPTFAAIPEPSRALLLGLGASGLLFRRRRSAQAA